MTTTAKHKILIVGGGTAGITVAARLLRKGETDVAVVEPADQHYYQAMWTLVGGGRADVNSTERSEASVMPKKATWIRNSAVAFDPDNNVVECADGARYAYDALIVCPGIQLDWAATEGLPDAMTKQGVASNYGFDLAPKTWELIRNTRSGTAVFMMPSGPIKCAGAPQKIAYLAADHADVRHPGDRRQPGQGGGGLRHQRAHRVRDHRHRRRLPQGDHQHPGPVGYPGHTGFRHAACGAAPVRPGLDQDQPAGHR
jgi:hypothetical protein